jgi:AraC family transcriptional regulator, regulatory protein of adaptative response / DNA-3-methyladenine glycosylase II
MSVEEIYYKAMLSKDDRFDGKFLVGVKTTGIYCRSICPAKPKRENIEFFPDALSPEKAGYRPCLRWQLISQNAMFDLDMESFAKALGISGRHIRRLFEKEVGLSPKKISDFHRLNFAQKLIKDTHLDLTPIALSSGFKSIRRFNDAFKKRYQLPPGAMRQSATSIHETSFVLQLAYRPPFDWKNLLNYYLRHKIPFVEEVATSSYQRGFKIDSTLGVLVAHNKAQKAQIELTIHYQNPKVLFTVVNQVRKMFDLDSDPLLISHHFSMFPFLNKLWEEFSGLRIAKEWDPFEIALSPILGQVVSVKHASKLMEALVKNDGEKIVHPLTKKETYLFTQPESLVNASLNQLKTTSQRKNAIRALFNSIFKKRLSFNDYQDPDHFKKLLINIKGIGNGSAEYILLRAFGDTNAFPADDLILKRTLSINSKTFDSSQIAPWNGYLAVYLWKKYAKVLSKKG